MNKQIQIWQFIRTNLDKDIPLMVLYVLESKGSSPGRQGFLMAVNIDGEMEGSIGGGIMEHKFVEMAKESLRQKAKSKKQKDRLLKKQVHDKSAARDQSGMICSGEQTILLYRPHKEDEIHIHNIITCLVEDKNGLLTLSPGGLFYSETTPGKDFYFLMKSEEDWKYEEKIGYKNHLFIVGGGHCSLALSKIMSQMDFYIHLFEDRKDLHTMLQNEFVHKKSIVENYTEISRLIDSGHNHYIVIMTFGYRTDEIALHALIGKQFKYFGLLGSRKKTEKMLTDLRSKGVAEDILQKIHSPIGLQIKSQTPEEIAVSIAAEIIKVKNAEK